MFSRNCYFLVLLLLFRESTAINPIQGPITGDVTKYEHTVPGNPSMTVVHADVVAPSGSAAIIDFALSTPVKSPGSSTNLPTLSAPCAKSSCPVTLVPYKFRPSISTWIQHLHTTFSVPAGSTPVIHFSPIEYGNGRSTAPASSNDERSSILPSPPEAGTDGAHFGAYPGTTASTSSMRPFQTPHTSPKGIMRSSGGETSPGAAERSPPISTPSTTSRVPNSTSQTPDLNRESSLGGDQHQSSAASQSNKGPKPSKSPQPNSGSQSSNDNESTSGTETSNSPPYSRWSPSSNRPYSRTPPLSSSVMTTQSPNSSKGQQSDTWTSVSSSPGDSPDSEMSSMLASLTGSSSAEIAVMLSHRPTNTDTVAWTILESEIGRIPTSTTTGAGVATGVISLAGWLTELNGNIQAADLKDQYTWTRVKNSLDEAKNRFEEYAKNQKNADQSSSSSSHGDDTGCSPGGGLFDIFRAVSCFIKKAEGKMKGGLEDIGPIIDKGLELTKTGLIQLKDGLPDSHDITDEEQKQFKNNFEDLTEGAETLAELEKEETKNSSSATAVTSSETISSKTSTCMSSRTVEDCTLSTLFITSTATGFDGSMHPTVITSTSSTCRTQTGCDIIGTTATATSYTQITGACVRRTPKFPFTFTSPTIESSREISYSKPATITSTSIITTCTTLATSTSVSTSVPCGAVSFQVASGWETLCACSTSSEKEVLTSTIRTPGGGNCGDLTAFPSTGFLDVPAATAYSELCGYHFGNRDGKDGYCACQTSMEGGYSSQWVALPYTQGTETVFECHAITSASFTPTLTQTVTAPEGFVTNYRSTDLGNGNIYAFATAYVTTNTNNYGHLQDFTPVVETVGMGTATFEEVNGYYTTAGLTTYYYASATGDGNGDVKPIGTPTAIVGPQATQNCARYVIPGPDTNHVYNSAKDETIYAFWGIAGWNTTGLEDRVPALLGHCNVTAQIDAQNTGRWGTVAMWNNGRNYNLNDCVNDGLLFLGAVRLDHGDGCKLISHDTESAGFWYENSAPAEIDWIYDNYPHLISSPYPLAT